MATWDSYFKYCPIKFTAPSVQEDKTNNLSILTQHCYDFLSKDEMILITCYCHGYYDNICIDGLFAKIGYNEETISHVRDEYRILSKLQDYDFVPKIAFVKEIDEPQKYFILFTQKINGASLDMIDQSDRRWKIGIIGALDLLYKLYIEAGFIHRDMHPNNIMVDENDKVYIIDFERCKLPGDQHKSNWMSELFIFNGSIDTMDDETFEKLEKWEQSFEPYIKCDEYLGNPDNFLQKIKEYKDILFP